MTDTRYNGWTNYETWAVKLWIDNEQSTQEYWLQLAQQIASESGEDDDATGYLAASLQGSYRELAWEAIPENGLMSDLLNAALASVNWREIAGNLIDEQSDAFA